MSVGFIPPAAWPFDAPDNGRDGSLTAALLMTLTASPMTCPNADQRLTDIQQIIQRSVLLVLVLFILQHVRGYGRLLPVSLKRHTSGGIRPAKGLVAPGWSPGPKNIQLQRVNYIGRVNPRRLSDRLICL